MKRTNQTNQTKQTTVNAAVMFEALEGRTMMSATPVFAAAVNVHPTAQLHQPVKKAAVKKPAPTKPAAPVVVEPKVTDSSIKYASFASDPLFSAAGPSVNDIHQGYIGDCYFLATLSGIAKTDPQVIRQDITANTDGSYSVKFNTGKNAQIIKVDTQLPVWPNGQLAYAGLGAQKCIWVAIMEKAFAEFRSGANSYASIASGWMTETFTDLGMKSGSTSSGTSASALLTLLQKDLNAGQVVTIGVGDKVATGTPLIGDHAYEVDAVNLGTDGKPVSVRLRNPWGVDGAGNDGNDDGYVTITGAQAVAAFDGVVGGWV